jgi:hypothetical protein
MVSHPIGTTVKAVDVFHGIPVRKQKAEKDAPKVIQNIRKLLHKYVLSRPNVRLSFKVLKAKNPNLNFTYAPKSGGGSVEDAVMKIFGKDCANQCSAVVEELDGFEFDAFLPKLGSDPTKIAGSGQHLSIDSRPVSTARGALKEVAAIFKSALKKHDAKFENIKDPILVLNIVCPPRSYDPNVEPLKDDVLFSDKAAFVACAERFFQLRYPRPPELTQRQIRDTSPAAISVSIPTGGRKEWRAPSLNAGSDHLLAVMASPERIEINEAPNPMPRILEWESQANQPSSCVSEIESSLAEDEMLFDQPTDLQQWKENMRGYDEEDYSGYPEPPEHHASCEADELEQANRDTSLSNPWIFAKMHAPIRNTTDDLFDRAALRENLSTLSSTPQGSSEFTPINRNNMSQLPFEVRRNEPRHHRQLLTPFPSSPSEGINLADIPEASSRRSLPQNRSVMKTRLRPGQGNSSQHGDSGNPNRLTPRQKNSGRNRDIRQFIGGGSAKEKPPRNVASDHGLVVQGQLEAPIIEVDATPPRQVLSTRTQPNRPYASNGPTHGDTRSARPDITPIDPVALEFFANPAQPQKRRRTASGPHRTKSAMLPLNRIPSNAQTQNIIHTIMISSRAISESLRKLDLAANSLLWGRVSEGAYGKDMVPLCGLMESEWSTPLGALLRLRYPDEAPVGDLESRLRLALTNVTGPTFD